MTQNIEPDTQTVSERVEGLQPVDPAALEPFIQAMDKAIPEMVDAEEKRRILAAESRRRQLSC